MTKKSKKAAAPKGSTGKVNKAKPSARTARFVGPASDFGDEVLVNLDEPAGSARPARPKK